MKLEQAARQALGALVRAEALYGQPNADIQTALREALAEQAEQEPVGVVEGSGEWGIAGVLVAGVPIGTKLYAAPVRVQDLTDDEIHKCMNGNFYNALDFARAVIAAYREKNK